MTETIRTFETGATRDQDIDKFDYEGFLSPQVLEEFAKYMHSHRRQSDGSMRASDNWQKGIPFDAYMKSLWRHFMDLWKAHRGLPAPSKKESLCAMLFNVQGYLLEEIKREETENFAKDCSEALKRETAKAQAAAHYKDMAERASMEAIAPTVEAMKDFVRQAEGRPVEDQVVWPKVTLGPVVAGGA